MTASNQKATADGFLAWLSANAGQRHGNFIAGKWETAQAESGIFNPGKPDQRLGFFAESSAEDVQRAVAAAEAAFRNWRMVPGPERGAILYRAADLIDAATAELAYVISAEQGKVIAESIGEIGRAVRELRFAAGEAFRTEGVTLPSEKPGGLAMTLREPAGVIAAITPWNFPIATPIRKIGPALAYGCTVVFKPSELTPWSAVRLVSLFVEAGVPAGVLNLVCGGGTVGRALVEHPRVAGVSFTGSTATGAAINATAAARFARTQLEMGGKNPAIVLDSRDPEKVARQIVSAAFICGGQRCTSVSRVIVKRDIAGQLCEALVNEMKSVRIGPAWDSASTMGPMVSAQHRENVLAAIDKAKVDGANVIHAGALDAEMTGHFVAPVLLGDVTPGMDAARKEIFGPVLTFQVIEDVDDGIAVANDVPYGLAASVFTDDIGTATRVMRQLETGMVHIGHGTNSEAHLPFGGVKGSGFGAFSIGHSNQEFYTTIKTVYAE